MALMLTRALAAFLHAHTASVGELLGIPKADVSSACSVFACVTFARTGIPPWLWPRRWSNGKTVFFSLQFLAGQPSWNLHVLNRLFGDVAFGTRTAESQPIQLASGCFHDRKACDDCYTIHTNIYRQKSTDTTPALSPKPTPLSIQESFECRDNIKTVFRAL